MNRVIARHHFFGKRGKFHALTGRFCSPSTTSSSERHLSYDGRGQTPLRMAIVGSGPAGFYTAYKVMSRIENATVDMFESLPVPFGLVRFGVAPDHPEVKNCQDKFSEVASSSRFKFIGNVDIGKTLPLQALAEHYNALVFSYGASRDRKLDIAGEGLNGVYSARDFVGWYNGMPEHTDLNPNLESGEEAFIIGQGNVALDVARILLSDVDKLRSTDIADHALAILARSRVKRVRIVGRRGPMQAAFTIKEARELLTLPGVSIDPITRNLFPPVPTKQLPRTQRRMVELLSKDWQNDTASKSCSLDFLLSPESFQTGESKKDLASIVFRKNELQGPDVYSSSAKVLPTEETVSLPTSLAFRSIGYKSEAMPGIKALGIQFDERKGIIVNDSYGRISKAEPDNQTTEVIPGLYCSGWVKRGPAGVIANTMEDAFATAEAITSDWENGKPFLPGAAESNDSKIFGIGEELKEVRWKDWLQIDSAEKDRGQARGKPREKFSTVKEMLTAVH